MGRKATLLVVDDEERLCRYLKTEFDRKGYVAHFAHEGDSALEILEREQVDVALLDIYMPGMGGVEVLRKIRDLHPLVRVIMLTGNASVETAVDSMKLGAFDYVTKPYNLKELCVLIDKAFEDARLRRENRSLRRRVSQEGAAMPFVGEDPAVREMLRMVEKGADSDLSALICGETGTGKELVARMLHEKSPRAEGPFLALNCSAFQDTLLESELFGHEKGAFTDAFQRKPGLVELAHEGSLFLDEIGDMALGIQAKLLRFLDTGEFRRLGGTCNMRADLRILSATNRDLPAAVKEGRFREDLFYRLNVVTIRVPPLRERKNDIPLLVEHFLKKYRAVAGGRGMDIASKALELLQGHVWPGNVRELENLIERAVILNEGDKIRVEDVSHALSAFQGPGLPGSDASLAEVERAQILRVLAKTRGNKSRAARILGVDVKTIYNKLRVYGCTIGGKG